MLARAARLQAAQSVGSFVQVPSEVLDELRAAVEGDNRNLAGDVANDGRKHGR
jgi:hypothetical protein